MAVAIIGIERDREHFKVTMGDKFYCTADTLKEALLEAEALGKILKAFDDDIKIDVEIAIDVKCK